MNGSWVGEAAIEKIKPEEKKTFFTHYSNIFFQLICPHGLERALSQRRKTVIKGGVFWAKKINQNKKYYRSAHSLRAKESFRYTWEKKGSPTEQIVFLYSAKLALRVPSAVLYDLFNFLLLSWGARPLSLISSSNRTKNTTSGWN